MVRKLTHGADVEQLDDIAVALRHAGTRVGDVGGRGAVLLEKLRAVWDGPDFEKFADQWRTAHRQLDQAEAAVRTFSGELAGEADHQRESSSASGFGVDGGVGVGPARHAFTRSEGSSFVPTTADASLAAEGGIASPFDLSRAEIIEDAANPTAFERLEIPTTEGAHAATTAEGAGQTSVAFAPDVAGSGAEMLRDDPAAGEWLGLGDPRPLGNA